MIALLHLASPAMSTPALAGASALSPSPLELAAQQIKLANGKAPPIDLRLSDDARAALQEAASKNGSAGPMVSSTICQELNNHQIFKLRICTCVPSGGHPFSIKCGNFPLISSMPQFNYEAEVQTDPCSPKGGMQVGMRFYNTTGWTKLPEYTLPINIDEKIDFDLSDVAQALGIKLAAWQRGLLSGVQIYGEVKFEMIGDLSYTTVSFEPELCGQASFRNPFNGQNIKLGPPICMSSLLRMLPISETTSLLEALTTTFTLSGLFDKAVCPPLPPASSPPPPTSPAPPKPPMPFAPPPSPPCSHIRCGGLFYSGPRMCCGGATCQSRGWFTSVCV